ncbi:WD repeat-containing protein 44 [Heracleum sosnowskyi]|uniref:WD repeat-containing protein 44 n=1 Tax=Heracleum sosnowskyi TaxID=360622 RepID=A0AAD8N121_9APIA|nr:WD repeat-containing protein 44 [Heracleum sosnowskyi]
MGSFRDEGNESPYFDAKDEIASSLSDSGSDICESSHNSEVGASSSHQYDVWVKGPLSVRKRRCAFSRLMGLSLDGMESCSDTVDGGCLRRQGSAAVLRNEFFEDEVSSSRSFVTTLSHDDLDLSRELSLKENFMYRAANGTDSLGHEQLIPIGNRVPSPPVNSVQQRLKQKIRESLVEQHTQQKAEVAENIMKTGNRVKSRWVSRFRSFSCMANRKETAESLLQNSPNSILRKRVQRVKVHHSKKHLKELSALFVGQDIQAHAGSILTMKFSPDGQYLASAGEDGIVRVWQIVEDERSNEVDIPDIDPSCIYFTVNHLSELNPLTAEQEKISRLKRLRKTADSACIIFPPVVFRISEKPLHEFGGHTGEILDLSWSKNNHLISSSVDKTVHLWKVGYDQCLKAFPHSNYVTCVQFNPVDDNQFISGSIDGKVRIWAIDGCQIVDWTDVRDLVTAVSYRPDGQGGIIGNVSGSCRFFSVTDDRFQLEAQMSLNSKKKPNSKRITGFQYFDQDPSKVMVTSADSQVKILQGMNIIGKFRGMKKGANQLSASFTSDGRHIVSACDDSNVYLWDSSNKEKPSASKPKTSRSFEYFSNDASVAIPWSGLGPGISKNECKLQIVDECLTSRFSFSPSACFSMGQGFFVEPIPKASATWPEEKLPASPRAIPSALFKTQYNFLKKSCQSSSKTHAWGLVLVTAGWDGRIRSFHNYGLPVTL